MPEAAPPVRTVLAFDYGNRRTGVAVGNTLTGTASPLVTLQSRSGELDWPGIERLVREWEPDLLVVGIPGGKDAPPQNASTRALRKRIGRFCRDLEARFGLPVQTVDETLSSHEAYAHLLQQRSAGRRPTLSREDIDRTAAALLLETWMLKQAPPA
jgi:putative Holliday junction resolvase